MLARTCALAVPDLDLDLVLYSQGPRPGLHPTVGAGGDSRLLCAMSGWAAVCGRAAGAISARG